MHCSPQYRNEKRQDVGKRPCNRFCIHWNNCLEELKITSAHEEYFNFFEKGLNTGIAQSEKESIM